MPVVWFSVSVVCVCAQSLAVLLLQCFLFAPPVGKTRSGGKKPLSSADVPSKGTCVSPPFAPTCPLPGPPSPFAIEMGPLLTLTGMVFADVGEETDRAGGAQTVGEGVRECV